MLFSKKGYPKSNPKGCSSLLRQWFQRCLVVHWQLHETLFCLAYVKCPLETHTPKLWESIDKYLQRVSSDICMGSRVASGKNMPQHRKFTNLLVYQFSTPAGIRSMILTLGMVLDGEGEFVWNCHASKILWFRNVQKLILWPLRLPPRLPPNAASLIFHMFRGTRFWYHMFHHSPCGEGDLLTVDTRTLCSVATVEPSAERRPHRFDAEARARQHGLGLIFFSRRDLWLVNINLTTFDTSELMRIWSMLSLRSKFLVFRGSWCLWFFAPFSLTSNIAGGLTTLLLLIVFEVW